MYTIYHVPGVKVGCSENVKKRIKQQGYDEYEIIEILHGKKEASEREIYWQKKLGYGRDSWNTYEGTRIAGVYAAKPKALAKRRETQKISEAWKAGVVKRGATWSNKIRNSQALQSMFKERAKAMITPEARAKRIESRKKPLLQFTKEKVFLAEWKSAEDVFKILNISRATLGSCARGKHKTAGGFIWKYKEE